MNENDLPLHLLLACEIVGDLFSVLVLVVTLIP